MPAAGLTQGLIERRLRRRKPKPRVQAPSGRQIRQHEGGAIARWQPGYRRQHRQIKQHQVHAARKARRARRAVRYGLPVGGPQPTHAPRGGSGVGRTLSARRPAVTGISARRQAIAHRALAPTGPQLPAIASAITHPRQSAASLVSFLGGNPRQIGLGSATPSSIAAAYKPPTVKQAIEGAALIGGPEGAGLLGRTVLRRLLERGGERVAAGAAERTAASAAERGAARSAEQQAGRGAEQQTARGAIGRATARAREAARPTAIRSAVRSKAERTAAVRGLQPGRTLGKREIAAGAAVAPPATKDQSGTPGTFAKTFVQAHLAELEHPSNYPQLAETTGKAAIGFAVTPVEIAGNVGLSAGRAGSTALHAAGVPGFRGYSGKEIAYPTEQQVTQLVDYGKDIAKTFGSGDLHKAQKAIEKDYGLTLPLVAIPGALKVVDRSGGRGLVDAIRRHGEENRAAFQRRYAEEVRNAEQQNRPVNPQMERQAARQGQRRPPTEGERQTLLRSTEHRRQRHEVAREHAVTEARIAGTEHNLIRDFEKRRRKIPGHRGVRGSAEVAPEDLAFTLASRGVPRDRAAGLAEIEHLDRVVGRGHVSATEFHDAQIIRHIARNPEVVWGSASKPLWDLVDRFKKGGAKVTRHGPISRARYIPIARAHGVPLPEELVPPEVEHMVPSRSGVSAKAALEDAARTRAKEAERLRARARTQVSHAKASRREAVRNARYGDRRMGDAKAKQAAYERRFAGELRDRAKATDAEAKTLRAAKKRTGVTRETTNRFVTSLSPLMRTAGERGGLEPPAMLHQQDVLRSAEGVGSEGARTYRRNVPARVQQSQGYVAEAGRGRAGFESAVSNLRNAHVQEILRTHIANFVQRWHIRLPADFLRRQGLRTKEGLIQAPGKVWARALREGVVNQRDVAFLDMGKVKGALEDVTDPQVERFRDEFVRGQATIDASKIDPKRSYIAVPRAAHDEFFAQFEPAGRVVRGLRGFSSVASRAILYSPAWQAAQVVAESTQGALAVGPYRLVKNVIAQSHLSREARLDLDAEIGGVSGGLPPAVRKRYLTSDLADRQRSALTALDRSAWGQALKTIPDVFVRIDRAKGAAIRRGVALAKIDRDLHGWHANVRAMTGKLDQHLQELRGMTWEQRARWYEKNPAEMRSLGNYVMDTMGDWQTYTRLEHTMASAVLFYPFFRMSLKWTFQSFPARHPIKTAILGFLATEHNRELRHALKGEPTFFQDWATMLLDTEPKQVVPISLARIVPGANPIVQATGQGIGPQIVQAANPLVGIPLSVFFGVDPNTGRPIQGSKLNYIISTIAREPAPIRMIDAITGPRSASAIPIVGPKRGGDPISDLINKLSPSVTQKTLSSTVVPFQLTTIEKMQDFIRLNQSLSQLGANGITDLKTSFAKGEITRSAYLSRTKLHDTAQKNLHDLFTKYDIPYSAEERQFFNRYGQTYSLGHGQNGGSWYGSSSSGSGTWYGSGGSSSKSWYGGG